MFRIAAVLTVLAIASIAEAGCGTARVGILQRHHENAAIRHQRIADRHANAANRIAVRRGTCATATATPAKAEQLPAPKK